MVELAAQEGHDADIPSNVGVVTHVGAQARATGDSTKSPAESVSEKDADKDLEKGALSSELEPVTVKTISDGNDGAEGENNEVGWDGDSDPNNPMNWSSGQKWGAVSVVAAITFLTPLGSSIFAPGVPRVMEEFHSDSELLSGFVVSVYVLGFAFGPLGMSTEIVARSFAYNVSHCSSIRTLRPALGISYQRRTLRYLHNRMRIELFLEYVDRISISCWDCWCGTSHTWGWNNCRSYEGVTESKGNVRMGDWSK